MSKESQWQEDLNATDENGNLKLEDISIEELFPDGCVVMASEPLPDVSVEEMRGRVNQISCLQEIVDAYAAADNKFWFIIDELYDYKPGSEEYLQVKHRIDGWKQLMEELEAKVVTEAKREGLLAPREPNSGLMKQLEPFMKKYGYENGAGWWIRKNVTRM